MGPLQSITCLKLYTRLQHIGLLSLWWRSYKTTLHYRNYEHLIENAVYVMHFIGNEWFNQTLINGFIKCPMTFQTYATTRNSAAIREMLDAELFIRFELDDNSYESSTRTTSYRAGSYSYTAGAEVIKFCELYSLILTSNRTVLDINVLSLLFIYSFIVMPYVAHESLTILYM